MLISNAKRLCTERGFHGHVEPVGYGCYRFVIGTAAGQYCLPVTPGMGTLVDTGRVNEYVVEAILLHDRPVVSTAHVTD
jgi:hypothetical protein